MDHTKNAKGKSAFNKRRACLMRKASELSILCDAEVALFGYSNDGELFEYASSNMAKIVTRFEKCRRLIEQGIPVNNDPEMDEDLLREEMENLKQDNDQHVSGMNVEGMDRKDLRELEQQLDEGLLCIKDRKEAILVQQLEKSRDQEQRYMQENETLRRKACVV
ncbi:agamous-like MADS-box protein AGL15 [Primulina huaijiensis]|uniref:agamous-like MADS-box protein AGL15 n=1 Tax=Primulina huaijiensis TaxID=1492673 RepID=UPI003CC70C20